MPKNRLPGAYFGSKNSVTPSRRLRKVAVVQAEERL
jgi:hypothetical protein